ncbi:MAG TPA: PaaI family thioesterase [Solirubrobacteraceae bacterium]
MDRPPPVPLAPRGFDALYGLELVQVGSNEVRARVAVRDEVRQPFGLVHGGVFASIAESVASIGTLVEVLEQGLTAMGMSNNTTFLRSITTGSIHAVGRPLHRGRTTWVWDVEITDDDDRVCATSRVTIAVRPPR